MWIPPEVDDPVVLHHPTRRSVGYFGAVRLRDGKFLFERGSCTPKEAQGEAFACAGALSRWPESVSSRGLQVFHEGRRCQSRAGNAANHVEAKSHHCCRTPRSTRFLILTVGLISVSEFQRLDFSHFVEVASIPQSVSNHLAAANRRFRFPSGGLLWFEHAVCARCLLTAPVAERDRWVAPRA
jgi:hypothetical protein